MKFSATSITATGAHQDFTGRAKNRIPSHGRFPVSLAQGLLLSSYPVAEVQRFLPSTLLTTSRCWFGWQYSSVARAAASMEGGRARPAHRARSYSIFNAAVHARWLVGASRPAATRNERQWHYDLYCKDIAHPSTQADLPLTAIPP